MRASILDGAARTAEWLQRIEAEPIVLLRKLRYEPVGHDPLTGEPLNVVEQLNQTFTMLVTLGAVERLLSFTPTPVDFAWRSGRAAVVT